VFPLKPRERCIDGKSQYFLDFVNLSIFATTNVLKRFAISEAGKDSEILFLPRSRVFCVDSDMQNSVS